ncbi:hypothetical protein VIGAN_09156900 [Vigna angularis var. angularis]|uniref:Uncharacterized protein n=1 Tax=Vigna angularis var. angularis TaxID=157739 RepID=A0A0S3SYL4_PHAAN|nr:hypothetical protein VIGAN_09156900 [Vigna angularis var. angularis]
MLILQRMLISVDSSSHPFKDWVTLNDLSVVITFYDLCNPSLHRTTNETTKLTSSGFLHPRTHRPRTTAYHRLHTTVTRTPTPPHHQRRHQTDLTRKGCGKRVREGCGKRGRRI